MGEGNYDIYGCFIGLEERVCVPADFERKRKEHDVLMSAISDSCVYGPASDL